MRCQRPHQPCALKHGCLFFPLRPVQAARAADLAQVFKWLRGGRPAHKLPAFNLPTNRYLEVRWGGKKSLPWMNGLADKRQRFAAPSGSPAVAQLVCPLWRAARPPACTGRIAPGGSPRLPVAALRLETAGPQADG